MRKREYGRKRVGEKVSEREREREASSKRLQVDFHRRINNGKFRDRLNPIKFVSRFGVATELSTTFSEKKPLTFYFTFSSFFDIFESVKINKKSVKKDSKKTFLVSSFNRSYLEKRPSEVLLLLNCCWPLFLASNRGPWKW